MVTVEGGHRREGCEHTVLLVDQDLLQGRSHAEVEPSLKVDPFGQH